MSTDHTLRDRPGDLRTEDSFDIGAAHAWLVDQVPGLTGPPEISQYAGGASNLTFLLRYPERDLILRRPPSGTKARSAHDMSREYTVQRQLRPVFGQVPEVLALCEDDSVIGSQFYVMERLEGLILRRRVPAGLSIAPAAAQDLCERMVDTLVQLHAVDPDRAGLSDLGRGSGYVRRQVNGWTGRFRSARTDNVPDFESVMTWIVNNQPVDAGHCVIHNDYRLDNLVLEPDDLSVRGLLDWEMATIGDPLMDLGAALAYWVQSDDDAGMKMAQRQPSDIPGMLTRDQMVRRYSEQSGIPVRNWDFYEVFGLFRVAVIAQQIYYRFHHGQTSNPAFKDFWLWVTYCESRCRTIADLP